MNEPGYSEVQPSLWPWLIGVALLLVVVSAAYVAHTAWRRDRRRLGVLVALAGNLALLVPIGWFLLAPATVARVDQTSVVTCLDPLSAASLHGVPDDSTMSPEDVGCRSASRTRLVGLGLGLVLMGAANGLTARKLRPVRSRSAGRNG